MSSVAASLERRALSLGTANAVDFGLQFLLPMVLTRTLDPHAFGQYRMLWLAVMTLMVITPMCMAPSLYYFLPRADRPTQRLYINQTMIFLLAAGLLSGWLLSMWNPFLPGKLEEIVSGHALVPAFVLLWVFASLLDVLPTAEERVGWQAKAIVSLSAVRAVTLSAAAILTHDLGAVLWMLLAFTVLKAGLLLSYVARYHGIGGPVASREAFAAQVRQAAPFAASGALHGIRTQADQWIAAALFSVAQFASFSIATVLAPLVQICRQSVNHVFLPSMSRLQSSGDLRGMLALNSRANGMVALLVYPLLAFAFVFAERVITLIYTATYVDAAPVLRLYIVGLVAFVVELVSVLFVMKQGPFAAKVNGLVLLIAIPLSLFGAMRWGLMGAAAGSVAAIYAERLVSLRRIATLTGTPVRQLQDWATLAGILAAAVLSAVTAGVALHWSEWSTLATLVAGAAIVAVTYPAALYLTGQWGEVTQFLSSFRHGAARP
ncbi:MAG TPA: oligosaccharide flippase family protein [Usitatibacter sp.]|nr:oligosaccharide flippase family protein [Usitatibacter sp.]